MKRKALIALVLSASCVLLSGCETLSIAPSEQKGDVIYPDIKQDSTETLRQCLANNKSLTI